MTKLAARLAATRAAVLASLASGPLSLRAVERRTGISYNRIVFAAHALEQAGEIVRSPARIGAGAWYCLPGDEPAPTVAPTRQRVWAPPRAAVSDLREASLEEVAAALGLAPMTVKNIEQAALRKLATLPGIDVLRIFLESE